MEPLEFFLPFFFCCCRFFSWTVGFPSFSLLLFLRFTVHPNAPLHDEPTPPTRTPALLILRTYLPLHHLRAAETSAYTRLDHGSLPAATHRPTWSRSSTSPTMMCVYAHASQPKTPKRLDTNIER